jgi:hypothetical protein
MGASLSRDRSPAAGFMCRRGREMTRQMIAAAKKTVGNHDGLRWRSCSPTLVGSRMDHLLQQERMAGLWPANHRRMGAGARDKRSELLGPAFCQPAVSPGASGANDEQGSPRWHARSGESEAPRTTTAGFALQTRNRMIRRPGRSPASRAARRCCTSQSGYRSRR